ncbi:MAG TPA: hypothetical protein PL124_05435 [Candidatus Cloacimonadota bacterium]|nr:hypothetical protein [Candidatus Cloacimonadota bacterium]HPS38839.1 hypothetical protein [Candidatus Cloacimonadota bacterium]
MTTKKKTTKKPVFDYTTIKTLKDAFKKAGVDPQLRPDVSMLSEKHGAFLVTAFLLAIVFEAINDGWEPDYSDRNQTKYFPWPWVSSSGLGFSYSLCSCGLATSGIGFRLCTDTADKAKYILDQFPDLCKEWFLNVKK